jgi:hypothetical protein
MRQTTTTTCIVGLIHEGSIWMGGDSAGVGGLSIVTRADKKVFLKRDSLGTEYGFGFTSSFRMGQLLQYTLNIPVMATSDLHEFMATAFATAVRQCFKDGGFTHIENSSETGGTFLVGTQGRLFYIDEDFQIGENIPNYSACGCGADLALGSLYTSAKTEMIPTDRLMIALEAAQEYSAGVRAPFNIIEVKPKKN